MKYIQSIIVGVLVYLALYFGEKGVHFFYFYLTHDFATSNLLMIKSSFMITFAMLLGGSVAGYLSERGLVTGFVVGIISGWILKKSIMSDMFRIMKKPGKDRNRPSQRPCQRFFPICSFLPLPKS